MARLTATLDPDYAARLVAGLRSPGAITGGWANAVQGTKPWAAEVDFGTLQDAEVARIDEAIRLNTHLLEGEAPAVDVEAVRAEIDRLLEERHGLTSR